MSGSDDRAVVTLTEVDSGRVVPGKTEIIRAAGMALGHTPAEPLRPRTRYRVEAALMPETQPPKAIAGPSSLSFVFETGDGTYAPLQLEGGLRVALETYDEPVFKCAVENPCGGSSHCRAVGSRRALRARVTLPIVRGGVAFAGYSGWLWLTDNTPKPFSGPGEGRRIGPGIVGLPNLVTLEPGLERAWVVFFVVVLVMGWGAIYRDHVTLSTTAPSSRRGW